MNPHMPLERFGYALFVLSVLMFGVVASASATDFSPAASMSAARSSHTATLLQNGTVLVAAGNDTGVGGTLASAEIYVPITNTWVTVGSLANTRTGHTATLLQNGKVLVTGGHAGTYIASAELYDPATKTWSSAGNMTHARTRHTATRLGNGKVLVTGGLSFDAPGTEIYDPATNSWSSAASMTTTRAFHTATLLANGKVLVVGGSGGAPSSSELYDPVTDSWTIAASIAVARWGHTATRLPNGMVLVVGGVKDNIWHAYAELYDAANNTWSGAGYLTAARGNHSEALLPSGKVLIAGGYNGAIEIASAEIYDPATNAWNGAGSMTTARSEHSATVLSNGTVLLAGGYHQTPSLVSLATTDVYDAATVSTTALSASPNPSVFGQSVTFIATVTGTQPTGSVMFMDGATTLCMTVALSAGQAQCAASALAAGSHNITAVYSGDENNTSSTGTSPQTVSRASTQTIVKSSGNPVSTGAPVTLTATVTPVSPGAGIPAGIATFSNGATVLGAAGLDEAGRATITVSSLPVGSAQIAALYSGNSNYSGSNSALLSVDVQALPTLLFSTSSLKVSETAGTVKLTVQRVGSVIGHISVSFSSANGTAQAPSDFAALSGLLTWGAGDGAPKTIVVSIVSDKSHEPDESFVVSLTAPSGATLGSRSTVTIVIKKR